ncbi:MAG: hypothetical protein J0L82_13780 [Deltaproteobacteria bacterium]|nr:hypothetical protein [Deltaproteobacteria bacterium]
MNFLKLCSLSLLVPVLFAATIASAFVRSEIPDSYDDYEGIDLAVKLAEDGKFKLADRVLKSTTNEKKDSDLRSQANRERVLGLLLEESAKGKSDLKNASVHFENAIRMFGSPVFYFDQQRVDLARMDYSSCVESVRGLKSRFPSELPNATPTRIRTAVKCFRLVAEQSARKDGQILRSEALALLDRAVKQNPTLLLNPVIASERVEVLADLGFRYVSAELAIETMKGMSNAGQKGISNFGLDIVDRLKLESGFLARHFAEKILQAALVYSPSGEQEDVLAAMAKLSFSNGQTLASATAFEKLSSYNSESKSQVYLASIELYRLAGWRSHANQLVQRIEDPKDRLRARVSGFFERDETAKIAAMFPSLDRHLLSDEEWVYLGAFARLQSGGWQEDGPNAPVKWLARLKRPENREKAAVLRQLVADCKSNQGPACTL